MWKYLDGSGWPRRTAQARRLSLRAHLVPLEVLGWSFAAGDFGVIALAGVWIVLFELVPMPLNAVPDLSRYPSITVVSMILMGAVAAPLTEEPAFRGYCQTILERNFSGPVAVLISSVFFALAHGPTQGFVWPKLLFYFPVGMVFGSTARLTNSILPAIPGHVLRLLVFFTMVWPRDGTRRLVWAVGPRPWFWAHVVQAIGFAGLTVWALYRLAKTCARSTPSTAPHASHA
jgi:membrane protease YdiL (CAAX protease family)